MRVAASVRKRGASYDSNEQDKMEESWSRQSHWRFKNITYARAHGCLDKDVRVIDALTNFR